MFFDCYPYTNFHNVNLDWVLQAVKAWGQTVEANDRAFRDLKEANEDFKRYVTNYLQDLDITDEINTKLDAMLASGVLTPYFAPYVKGYVDSWLASHVTPTSPALDSTLTLSGAAARADSTGKRLKDLAYVDALSTPEIIAALNRSQVLPGYRVQGITYDYNGHYYVCGGSVDETGTGVIVKMTKPDFTDAEITEIPQLGHANDITYYDGYLYVCTVGGGNSPRWGIYKINVNDFTDKTLISNAPENTIGISYRQGDFWILAPYRIYRTTDFTSYEVVVGNTNDLLTAYGIPTTGRISQTIFRAAGYLIGWVCSFVFEDRHYGALTFFNSAGEAVAFKMFPAYHSEIQGAVYADMSIYLVTDGNMVNVFRMDPRHLSYVQLKAGDDLNSFTGRGTLYSTGSNVSAELLNSPSAGEGFTVQVDRLGVYNTIQTARTNSGRELYRIKSFNNDTWGEWIEPAAEIAEIKEDLSASSETASMLLELNAAELLGPSMMKENYESSYGLHFDYIGGNAYHVYGTTTRTAFYNLYNNKTQLPLGMKAGETYQLTYSGENVSFYAYVFTTDAPDTMANLFNSKVSKKFTIPSNAIGIALRISVTGAGVVVDETVAPEITNEQYEFDQKTKSLFKTNSFALLSPIMDVTDYNSYNVTMTYIDSGQFHVQSAGSERTAFKSLFKSASSMPNGMNAGETYFVSFTGVNVHFYVYYTADGTNWVMLVNAIESREFTIPEEAIGLEIRITVLGTGTIVDEVVSPEIYTAYSDQMLSRHLLATDGGVEYKQPLITIIDDDGNLGFYTDLLPVIESKNISIATAVIGYRIAEAEAGTRPNYMTWDKIVDAYNRGAEVLSHSYSHWGEADVNTHTVDEVATDYTKMRHILSSHGIDTGDILVYPGASGSTTIARTASERTCLCAIRASGNVTNFYGATARYNIKRYRIEDEYRYDLTQVEQLIDELAKTGGWMVWVIHTSQNWNANSLATVTSAIDYALAKNIPIVSAHYGAKKYLGIN